MIHAGRFALSSITSQEQRTCSNAIVWVDSYLLYIVVFYASCNRVTNIS